MDKLYGWGVIDGNGNPAYNAVFQREESARMLASALNMAQTDGRNDHTAVEVFYRLMD